MCVCVCVREREREYIFSAAVLDLFSVHRVKEAAGSEPSSRWEPESSGDDDEEEFLSEEQKQHKKEFRDWRKKHYNEFMAVKRARELMKQVSRVDKYIICNGASESV